ncbi:MAG: hypothetical protein HY428_02445 [Candidatus Levybacteria bacterium]|nr:hypothetical protein [Candidatus Levybacteria bacterium]
MKKNSILITVVMALIVAVAAFYGGMQYQQRQRPNFAGFRGGQNGQQFQGRGNFQGARPVNGEIISQDDKSITVKMQNGSSKIVILSDQTIINKASEGSKSDLKTGEKVAAFGTENSDGSITAQNISIGGMLRVRQ